MKKILLYLILTGCGFQPMFTSQNIDIYVSPVTGINGIALRNAINAKLGGQHSPDATYTLKIDLQEPNMKYKAIETTGDATWQEINITATYELLRNNEKIAMGTETASESYTFVRYLVASNASYNNAVSNIIGVLADKISMRAIADTAEYESKK